VSFVFVMGAMAFVTEPWHVFALRAVQGLFAGYGALTLTMAADSAPSDRMAYAIGVVQTAQRLGPALGPVIGGVVAQLAGLRRAFFVTSAFYLIAVVIVFLMYKERLPAREPGAEDSGRVTFRNVLAFENFLLLMLVVFGLQFVDRSFGPILPLYVAGMGTPTSTVPIIAGLLFSITAGTAAVGNQVCARLLRRHSPRRVIASASALASAGTLVYVFANDTGQLVIGTILFGVAIGTATTATYTAAGTLIPASVRGTGFGLLSTASLAGLAVSPIVSGLLGAVSLRGVFLLDTIALLLTALVVRRLMVTAPVPPTSAPAAEEL
jgi:DHA1 family multidrug resistance protein-like MFS transporter